MGRERPITVGSVTTLAMITEIAFFYWTDKWRLSSIGERALVKGELTRAPLSQLRRGSRFRVQTESAPYYYGLPLWSDHKNGV
jgi:hypothetical protein